jgi:hypothetical protein
MEVEVKSCCIQFYKLELDHKIWIRNRIIRIIFLSKDAHMLCWVCSKGLYGKLGWGFIKKSDMCFNVRIGDNRVRIVK